MCSTEPDWLCDVWRETPRKARKSHRCDSCRVTIAPGENYIVHFSTMDGSVTSEKCCAACELIRQAFIAVPDHRVLYQPSYTEEMLQECVDDGDDASEKVWKPMLEQIRARREASRVGAS